MNTIFSIPIQYLLPDQEKKNKLEKLFNFFEKKSLLAKLFQKLFKQGLTWKKIIPLIKLKY